MGRASAPPRRATSPVEDRQLDAAPVGDQRQLLLGAIDLPLGGQVAAVLARVRVPHHHLQALAGAAVENLLDERAGLAEVGDRLEQRYPLELAPAAFASPPPPARRPPTASSRRSPCRRPAPRAAPGHPRQPRRTSRAAARRAPARPRRGHGRRAWRDGGRTCVREPGGRRGARRRPVRHDATRRSIARPSRSASKRRARRVGVGAEPVPDLDEHRRGTARRPPQRSGTSPITVVDIPHAAPSSLSSAR